MCNKIKVSEKLIDILGKKEDKMKEALELIDNAPQWARELEKSSPKTLEILHNLFLGFKRRNNPILSGNRGIKNIVSESINAAEFLAFASQFSLIVEPDFGKSALNAKHYPFTADTYDKIVFEMLDPTQITNFLNIFKNLVVPLDVVWVVDNLQKGLGIRIDSPEENASFLFDNNRIKETMAFCAKYDISVPVNKRAKVNLGRIMGRKRYCSFKIIYIQKNEPQFPGGSISLDYCYDVRENGVLKDMMAEGESTSGKDIPTDQEAEEKVRSVMIVVTDADIARYRPQPKSLTTESNTSNPHDQIARRKRKRKRKSRAR